MSLINNGPIWYPGDWYGMWTDSSTAALRERPVIVTLPPSPEPPTEERRENMRGLFEVYIVHPATEEVAQVTVVARDESLARIKAALLLAISLAELDQRDMFVRRIGDVRAKREVQE